MEFLCSQVAARGNQEANETTRGKEKRPGGNSAGKQFKETEGVVKILAARLDPPPGRGQDLAGTRTGLPKMEARDGPYIDQY